MKNFIIGMLFGLTIAAGSAGAYMWDINKSFSDNQNAQDEENRQMQSLQYQQQQNEILRQQQYRRPC